MRRDQRDQHQDERSAPRYPQRKEWSNDLDRSEHSPGRELAGRSPKTRRVYGILDREADRQIRELRAR